MLKALILVGGVSSRMGKDKYLLNVNSKPQYIYLAELLKELNIPIYISCNKNQQNNIESRFDVIVDIFQGVGPMGGIASAFELDNNVDWLVIACDLILIDRATIKFLISKQDEPSDIITFIKRDSDFPETTITIYKSSTHSLFKQAIADKSYSLQKILRKCKLETINPPEKNKLWNANTPIELQEAQKFIKGLNL
ncbi:molybdenum cofactor guanylyltransferase [Chondrinema litorale]|uniref:molybdenum cofactor guanylyltransferase n=1 Tax=Chondrinema litorale TaxID=2994555 RepID=UPI002543BF7B|nr:molybdenum cofactor guanylyltransferase [Chondrinema litorale]UZR98340.1 molybdenum cofactor guanylyltransferase [Chondrinema litorale]